MSSDDLTQNLSDSNEDDQATQPTITAVFRLLQDLDKRLNGRFDEVETRLGALETRLAALEIEMKTGFIKLGDKLADEMDRTRLHADADREDLLRRIRRLESKAS